jgi:hypothetical protein
MADIAFGLVIGGSIGIGIGLVLVIGLIHLLSERLRLGTMMVVGD